jgi:hypothetical protein
MCHPARCSEPACRGSRTPGCRCLHPDNEGAGLESEARLELAMVKSASGVFVPIPTLPFELMRMRSILFARNITALLFVVPGNLCWVLYCRCPLKTSFEHGVRMSEVRERAQCLIAKRCFSYVAIFG